MKHLLNGVAIAAALAITLPAWAQTPMTPAAPKAPAASAPMAAAPAAAKPMKPRKHRKMAAKGGKMRMHKAAPADQMTEQLNREELARVQGGAPAPAPMAPPSPGPRASGH